MDNTQIVKKADLALADLASGGFLTPEQTDKFIRRLIKSPTVLQGARVVSMNSPTKKINKIGFGQRILRAAPAAGVALAANQRVKPDLGQITLNTKEVIAEVRLPYDVLEDNIEGGNPFTADGTSAGGLMDTIIALIAERAALDLEELCLLGDTTSLDPYLALTDGWIKKASVSTGTTTSAIGKAIAKQALKTMPEQYLRNRASLRYIMSMNNDTDLRDLFADRQTALGDAQLQGQSPLFLFGSQTMPASLMPSNTLLYTNPLNLIFGVQRKISLEYTKDITTRTYIIVLTARIDVQIEEAEAAVRITGITS